MGAMLPPRANFHATGANVCLSAVSETGQQFPSWSGDAKGTLNPCPLSMDASKTMAASFTRNLRWRILRLDRLIEDGLRLTPKGEFGQAYRIAYGGNFTARAG